MSDVSSSAEPVPQQASGKVENTHFHSGLGPPVAAFHSSTLPKGVDVPTPPVSTGRKKTMNPFDTAQDNYLIFLKEVKQFTWAQITEEYNKDMPQRLYAALQSRYSTFLNKRDRSQDPPTLLLPPRWAAEATIDWNLVRGTSAPLRGWNSNHTTTSQAHPLNRQERAVPKHLPIQQTIEQDYSSGGDSAPRRERSRRAQRVNYTWPKQRGVPRGGIEEDFEDDSFGGLVDDFAHTRSDTSPDDDIPIPSKAVAVDNEPVDVQFDVDDAEVGLSLHLRKRSRKGTTKVPYLSTSQRLSIQNPPAGEWDQLSSRDWQGTLLHVDFSPTEIASVEKAITLMKGRTAIRSRHSTKGRQLREHLKGFTEPQILRLAESLLHLLPCRDRNSIKAFMRDAMVGDITEVPQIQRLAAVRPDMQMLSTQSVSTSSIIRQRELGLQSRRGWQQASKPLTYQVKNKYMDTMGPAACWTGASSDIHTVAWAPDGERFAAGAVAVDDPDSMQYNRPNNLLFGSAMHGTIYELAEHYKIREKTESGANSSHAMFASQDPNLYTTVSAVAFSNSSPYMYSAGYDGHIGIWRTDTEATQPMLAAKLNVKDQIDILSVNRTNPSIIATAAKVFNEKAIRVLKIDEDEPWQFDKWSFHSNKAVARADLRILPSALQFEPTHGAFLLAGFGANMNETGFDMTGDLCLWDVETQSAYNIYGSNKNVFDVTFNPNRSHLPLFAAGCVATGSGVNRGTRSTVRLYDVRDETKFTCQLEFECKALDMNDVIWCPHDEQLIAAGCTDGKVYVWDARSPNDPLRILSHGQSLMPLQEGIKHEITDTGVRFLSWGDNATRLYSGSSDGVVKVWDVTRAEENTFIKDLITTDSGIMSASFSPDYSKLVVGEVNGSVNVLEVGRHDTTIKDADRLRYMPYQDDEQDDIQDEADDITSLARESGIAEGAYLLQTQQMQLAPMGSLPIRQVVQGVNYAGPLDQGVDAPFLREQALQFQLGLTTSPGPQCDISACKDNLNKVTSEDVGDSGRSEDRIPDELRQQWKTIDAKNAIIPGKSKCTHCGRPARPSTTGISDNVVLCERCSFACFRCGSVNPVPPATTTLICDSCAGVWDIGVLGYECVQQPSSHNKHMGLDVPALKRWGEEAYADQQEDFDTNHGDEINALTDYYLSLAINRPESPPL
jgi:WD40 repeat protein